MINFFIERPIFSTVIAIIMTLVGAIAAALLPIAQYPEIAPPQVAISSEYTGANAEVVSDAVTTPIEEQVNGVKGMIYVSSNSTNNGTSEVTITFDVGYDLDIAAVDVQNKLSIAKPQLPEDVRRAGIKVEKKSPNLAMVVNLVSPNGTLDDAYLGNYADIHVKDVIKRISGVGKILNFGLKKYSIRIWLDPHKMAGMGVTASDVSSSIREQNRQVAAGKIGASPAPAGQVFQYQLSTLGRLDQVDQFEDIILRTRADGTVVRVRDVARVELGAESYTMASTFNDKATASIGIYQLPGSNLVDLSKAVHEAMDKLAERFPDDLEYVIAYDTSNFVKESLTEVVITLLEAIALVLIVVFVFLQDWRMTIIPSIAIPVSLIATFGFMAALGFSINTLSLLGLVLAIGLVVDDAIVVVENVARQLEKGETDLKKAAKVAMQEVTAPIIATTLVLMAVFIPVAFMPGMTGQLYNQFALTVAISVGLSAINSLSLSPALSSVFLRPPTEKTFFFFVWFNKIFDRMAEGYKNLVGKLAKVWYLVIVAFIAVLVGIYVLFANLPEGFVPEEDQGYILVSMQAPDASTLGRVQTISKKVGDLMKETPGVKDVLSVAGFNLISDIVQSNAAFAIAVLEPWDERTTQETQFDAIMAAFQDKFQTIDEALVLAFNAPAIPGLGATGGFKVEVRDLDDLGTEALAKAVNEMVEKGNARPELQGLFTTFASEVPQLYLEIDRTKAKSLNLSLTEVFDALQIYLGSMYVNDLNKYGRVYRVYAQAEQSARDQEQDISSLKVRNKDGEMIPLGALVKTKPIVGPSNVPHYNLYKAAPVNGGPAPGYSSGQAIKAVEEVADEVLPHGMGIEWTGVTYQQLKAGNLAPIIFTLSLIFCFLFLAAQYESWGLPIVIILAVPAALLGASAALAARGLALDVYGQIGLVMLIGLAAKNAILIVEFANRLHEQGADIVEAAMEAAKLRLRPILMTTFAFLLGVLPLAMATGAGANSRHSLGTTVIGGMFVGTFAALIMVPIFYILVQKIRERGTSAKKSAPATGGAIGTKAPAKSLPSE